MDGRGVIVYLFEKPNKVVISKSGAYTTHAAKQKQSKADVFQRRIGHAL